MNAVLLDTLSQILGSQLTPGASKAWVALLNVLTKVVSEEIERLDEEAAVVLNQKIKSRKAKEVSASSQ